MPSRQIDITLNADLADQAVLVIGLIAAEKYKLLSPTYARAFIRSLSLVLTTKVENPQHAQRSFHFYLPLPRISFTSRSSSDCDCVVFSWILNLAELRFRGGSVTILVHSRDREAIGRVKDVGAIGDDSCGDGEYTFVHDDVVV